MKHQTRIVIASLLGNLIEAFDMAICGLSSIYLAKYLIGDESKGVFLIFLTFFAGYLARPIGATIMGILSDIYGRKIILAASILGMGISTAAIGFIPSDSAIGIAAMVLLVILRVIQSFSAGAEYLNSSAYLIESVGASNKGYLGSWVAFGATAGMLIASFVFLGVSYLIKKHPELEWMIWRTPFVLALLGSSIGLYIRVCMPESIEYVRYYANHSRPNHIKLFINSFKYITEHKLKCINTFLLSYLGVTITFQIYIYAPSQAHVYGNFSDYQIIISNIVALGTLLCFFPVFGMLSDRISRERIVAMAGLGFMLFSQPFFYFLATDNFVAFLCSHILISIAASAYSATVPVILPELFPVNLRCTVLSVIYSSAASLAAGLAPLMSLILVEYTDNSVSPSWLLICLVVLALTFMRRYNKNVVKLTV
ncbi:MAG: MFS transporter [Legionella sp.]|uniref:MFS transporter n=1 Tax=Legionella sp. TaxID=459 RepID=UPI0039E54713